YNAMYFGCYEDIFHQPHSIYFSRYPFIREATIGFPAPDLQWRNDTDAVAIIDTSYTPGSITVTIYGNNGGRVCESETSGNTNTRIMTFPDGTVERQSWSWTYRPELPPETTTTTAPPATTTTVAPTTTTTVTTTSSTTTTTTTPPEEGGGGETP
ncbi:MAG: VanW family protein, partial [Acidimicrobiia bacterium]